MRKHESLVRYFVRNISVVVGLVLIWRGVWYLLDFLDIVLGNSIITVVGGFVVGLLILYLPDKDLKEIQQL